MDITEDAILVLSEGLPDFERYTYAINNIVKFNGKSLNEWQEEVKIPSFNDLSSLHEQDMLNHIFIEKCETIMSNLARARVSRDYAKMHYRTAIIKEKDNIIRNIHAWNNVPQNIPKKKIPGSEILEEMANSNIMETYIAYKLSDTFFEFWDVLYNKINMINYRLTGMNVVKNIESRLGS